MQSTNPFMKYFLVPVVVNLVRLVVTVYTILSWPLYFVVQQPWKRLRLAKSCGAHLVGTGRISPQHTSTGIAGYEYIEFERYVQIPMHPLMKCNTLTEAMKVVQQLYPADRPALGYRQVLEEEVQRDRYGNPIKIDGKVLRKYRLSHYHWITYGQFNEMVEAVSRGLRGAGLKRHDAVGIYSETGIDFSVSNMAAATSGALIVTLFNTLTDEGLVHALNETRAKFIFVSFELLDRLTGFIKQCPHLKTVIYFEGPQKQKVLNFSPDVKVYTLTQMKELGRSERCRHIQLESLDPDDLFGVMYTSGTTGIPKGVQITQRQIKEAALGIGQAVRDVIPTGPDQTYIAYLPQAHVLEFSLQFFLFIGGVKIGYATPFTLNESAPGLAPGQICDLQLLKPTVMTTVPLVLDRMQKEIYAKLQARTPFSKAIFDYLISYKAYWIGKGYQTPIVNRLLCGKVQQQFGGNLKYMVVGSAPLAPHLQMQIKCATNVTLVQGYGTTETSGGVIAMDFHDLSFGRIGAPLNGVRVRMVDWADGGYTIHDRPNPRGELIIGGKMISKGYLNRDDLNSESFFDENGFHWFITGDIGQVFPDGTFRIIDRKKDIIKLANGEFISLGKIEAALKSSQYVDNICIVANATLNCLVGLVQPNPRALYHLAEPFGFPVPTAEQTELGKICRHAGITETVYQDIIEVGRQQKLKPIELPSMVTLCPDVWAPDNNLLTAAMKLKRVNIYKHYKDDLERMWNALKADPSKIRVRISQ